jgi:Na+/proline symporter
MAIIVIAALLISALIYLYVGFSLGNKNKTLADLFPIIFGRTAKVNTVDEFSSSTTATTISLATVVLAYFELAGYFGVWLLWSVATTAIGVFVFSAISKRIWKKMSIYTHRPSMHEFIGIEFNSKLASLVASICTSVGFLLIFATELTVGSKFLAGLIPSIPQWITVIFLSAVGFIYTLLGGFRAVIKTDQYQMKFIWALIIMLGGYYIYYILQTGGVQVNLNKMPSGILDFSPKQGLGFFLLGIAVMNIPLFASNMSIWQRVSGVHDPEVVVKGIKKSIWSVTVSWTLLALLACFAYMIVTPASNQTLLTDLLVSISGSAIGKIVLFFVVIGLYGAMLSTASTNLIVVGHTISEDIFAKFRKGNLDERVNSKKEFLISRLILFGSTLLAIFLVEGLKYFGFSIADLAFSIYGGALALFPPIMAALYSNRTKLQKLSGYATASVILGFFFGWAAAIYGKIINDSNLIFLAPCFSILVSGIIIIAGFLVNSNKKSA